MKRSILYTLALLITSCVALLGMSGAAQASCSNSGVATPHMSSVAGWVAPAEAGLSCNANDVGEVWLYFDRYIDPWTGYAVWATSAHWSGVRLNTWFVGNPVACGVHGTHTTRIVWNNWTTGINGNAARSGAATLC